MARIFVSLRRKLNNDDAVTITTQLSQILTRPISDSDRKRAALLVLDWTGCAVAGRSEAAGEKIAASFQSETGTCTRIGASPASPQMAALHNGCLGNILEMDDVDKRAVLHAAPTVVPAALAMAEHVEASATDCLDAIVIGYEATIRIGRAVGAGHYAYWHNTATCGPFGAAAAACHLLTGSDIVSALGLAGTQSAGLWQTRHEADSMAKQLHAGHAAQVGVQSAFLSAQGFQGPRSILEGEQGFFAAMCPDADPQDILADFGKDWLIHQTSIKPYSACRHAHAAIDAALMARDAGVKDGENILIETYTDALKFCDRSDPKSVIEAKFSLQHSVAVTLAKGWPELDDFEPENVSDDIQTLRSKIETRQSADISADYPAHYSARLIIDGHSFYAKDAYGDPEAPLSDRVIFNKAVSLLEHSGMTERAATDLCRHAVALSAAPASLTAYTDRLP